MSLLEIRRGVTRTVILTKRYAIKVPRLKDCKGYRAWTFVRGWAANMSEVDWTGYATKDEKPQVCPVLKSYLGGIINVYPRAEVVTDEAVMYEEHGKMWFSTPADIHLGNFGWLDGNFVWLDYDMNWNDCRKCGGTCV